MKNLFRSIIFGFFMLFITAFTTNLQAQVTLNCESGNRAIEQGNCWGFGATSYSNTANLVIEGAWSVRTNSLTSLSPSSCWIKTPWMVVGNGKITFQARLDGAGNGVTAKQIFVAYIPFNQTASYGEGTPVQFFSYDFPAFNVTTISSISVPIPAEIQNPSSVYKFWVSFAGTGGNERAYADNFIFPGTYLSDPSNSCLPKVVIKDADADGVADENDNYPKDPFRAYNSFYPSEKAFGTLAFEDSWPNKSDYDMNDLLVNYRFSTVTNASNNIVEIIGNFVTRASGASYRNGFGFQLDGISPDQIKSVSGCRISDKSVFTMESNGQEANQKYANCIVFDDFFNVMKHPGSGTGINTSPDAPKVPYDTITVTIRFIEKGESAPGGSLSIKQLNPEAYNFYIVVNQKREIEVHLPDFLPTNLANTELLGTGSDDSNPGKGKYYKTLNNLPWGINIVRGFDYPVEKVSIDSAYLHFIDWARSSGELYRDWYSNQPGYRVGKRIY